MSSRDNPIVRPTARVVLLNAEGRLLLLRAREPDADTGRPFWFTPGGGLEAGESYEDAARREVFEETGISDITLDPAVWLREHLVPWRGQWLKPIERYYVARTGEAEIVRGYLNDVGVTISEHKWWSVDEITASPDLFVPRRLAELVAPIVAGNLPPEPIAVGV